MTLRRFRPPQRQMFVTVRPDGRLVFNSEASKQIEAAGVKRFRLFGDPKTKEVLLRPAQESANDVMTVTYIRQRTHVRASVEAAPFLRWMRYHSTSSTRFSIMQLARHAFRFVLTKAMAEPAEPEAAANAPLGHDTSAPRPPASDDSPSQTVADPSKPQEEK